MSDGFWIFAAVRADRHDAARALADTWAARPIDPPCHRAHAQWRAEPDALVELRLRSVQAFSHPFVTLQYDDEEVHRALEPEENPVLECLSLTRVLPPAALFRAIGPERADRLPGKFGTFFLPSDAVPAAIATVRDALDVPVDAYRERLARLLEGTGADVVEDGDLLRQAPVRALELAAAEGRGLIVYTLVV